MVALTVAGWVAQRERKKVGRKVSWSAGRLAVVMAVQSEDLTVEPKEECLAV
jgi:hypothetical protein